MINTTRLGSQLSQRSMSVIAGAVLCAAFGASLSILCYPPLGDIDTLRQQFQQSEADDAVQSRRYQQLSKTASRLQKLDQNYRTLLSILPAAANGNQLASNLSQLAQRHSVSLDSFTPGAGQTDDFLQNLCSRAETACKICRFRSIYPRTGKTKITPVHH